MSKSIFDPDEFLKEPGLPSSADKLFTSQEDWWNNACLNWCRDGWSLYAVGYKDAGDILAREVENRNSGQDTLVYPILFLYRQYLELEIKDLIRTARRLQDLGGDFPKNHRISLLSKTAHDGGRAGGVGYW